MKPNLQMISMALLFGVLAVGGCVQPLQTRLTLPDRYLVVRDQLVFYSDFPLASHHRLLEELLAERGDLCGQLALPVSNEPIHIYLFETAQRFEAFMRLRHPNYPQRRAFFLETDTRLEVYAQWGDRVAEDLRHEVAHGYLHSVVPSLPMWLDEGLAEYFEVPRGSHGLNRDHLNQLAERLAHGRWQPNLVRLEGLDPAVDMGSGDYAESWAWVHFLLETCPEHRDWLRDHLRQLRERGSVAPLSAHLNRMFNRPEEALVAHIRYLAGRSRPGSGKP